MYLLHAKHSGITRARWTPQTTSYAGVPGHSPLVALWRRPEALRRLHAAPALRENQKPKH